jgi:hypothetical protein
LDTTKRCPPRPASVGPARSRQSPRVTLTAGSRLPYCSRRLATRSIVDVVLTTVAAAAGGLSHPGQSGVCTTMEQAGVGVDWSLPLLGSGVRDRCQPSATVTGRWLTAAGCVLRILGWGFATGFAAGFTGDFPEGMRLGRDEDPTGRWPQVFLHGSDTKSTQIDSRFSPHPALHQETRPARNCRRVSLLVFHVLGTAEARRPSARRPGRRPRLRQWPSEHPTNAAVSLLHEIWACSPENQTLSHGGALTVRNNGRRITAWRDHQQPRSGSTR